MALPVGYGDSQPEPCLVGWPARSVNDLFEEIGGSMKIVGWALIGAAAGTAFGVVWQHFEPGLALFFWPVLGALIFGQHAFRSGRDKGQAEPPSSGEAP